MKQELQRRRVLTPKGTKVRVTAPKNLRTERLSLFALCQLDETYPVVISGGKGTNNQFSFLQFVKDLLSSNHLQPGDILVMDNSSIHHGAEIQKELEDLQREKNFSIKFLPAYSPELNPIELIFGWVKNKLRSNIKPFENFEDQIKFFFCQVSFSLVFKFYCHCFFNFSTN